MESSVSSKGYIAIAVVADAAKASMRPNPTAKAG